MQEHPYLRVVSFRREGTAKTKQETVMDVSRRNLILGNPFIMKGDTEEERTRVIRQYRRVIEEDFEHKGEKFYACVGIARQVLCGESIALSCWCAPQACHADVIREKVLYLCTEEGRQLWETTA